MGGSWGLGVGLMWRDGFWGMAGGASMEGVGPWVWRGGAWGMEQARSADGE